MTKKQANIEAKKIIDSYIEKTSEIEKEAKINGTWVDGLDANNSLFVSARKERDEKLKVLATMIEK